MHPAARLDDMYVHTSNIFIFFFTKNVDRRQHTPGKKTQYAKKRITNENAFSARYSANDSLHYATLPIKELT